MADDMAAVEAGLREFGLREFGGRCHTEKERAVG